MTVGEKIKTFRNIRGISQNMLGQLAGIDGTTIRKYELGSRNPKPDQLLKIANALGVSINVFTDFDIETASDVLTLLFKMDDPDRYGNLTEIKMRMEISFQRQSYIRFKHPAINNRLAKFAKQRNGRKSACLQRRISKRRSVPARSDTDERNLRAD